MDVSKIINILFVIAVACLGYVVSLYRTNSEIQEAASNAIAEAEETYKDVEKAGKLKMEMCIQQLRELVPAFLRPLLTDEVIEEIVQKVFDSVKKYSEIVILKVLNKE